MLHIRRWYAICKTHEHTLKKSFLLSFWSIHNIWYWRKDEILTLWGFPVKKFKNTHIVEQQTSSPSICHSLLYATVHPQDIHFEGTVFGFSQNPSSFALTPTSEYHQFNAACLFCYIIISYHTTSCIIFALTSTFSTSSIYVHRKPENKVFHRWPTHRTDIGYKRKLPSYTLQLQLSVYMCHTSFPIPDKLWNIKKAIKIVLYLIRKVTYIYISTVYKHEHTGNICILICIRK